MKPILVIGATGTVGRQIVVQLSSRGAQVRALTRNPDLARFHAATQVVRGDLTYPDTLDAALDGVDRVFLIWTAPAGAAPAALDRIVSHARRIVFLTAPLKTPHPLWQQPNPSRDLAAHIEQFIESSGLEWTFLRCGMFAANARRWWAPQTRAGDVVRWPYLDVETAPIHENDIAAVGVRALCESGHAGAEYLLTGPEPLSHFEQISTIGRSIGRPLRIEEVSPEEARSELLSVIPVPSVVDMLIDAWAAAAGKPAYVTSNVEAVTGTPARSFEEWAMENASKFQCGMGDVKH